MDSLKFEQKVISGFLFWNSDGSLLSQSARPLPAVTRPASAMVQPSDSGGSGGRARLNDEGTTASLGGGGGVGDGGCRDAVVTITSDWRSPEGGIGLVVGGGAVGVPPQLLVVGGAKAVLSVGGGQGGDDDVYPNQSRRGWTCGGRPPTASAAGNERAVGGAGAVAGVRGG
jgi:hypothetical protein